MLYILGIWNLRFTERLTLYIHIQTQRDPEERISIVDLLEV